MRLVVSGGGTGGHVYPALAVLAALREPPSNLTPKDILYIGVRGRTEERLVPQAGYPFAPVAAGAVLGRGPFTVALSGARIALGTLRALTYLRSFRPDAILATGGYVSVPVALAGWLARIPVLLYLPDAEPGLAVRLLARVATRIAVTVPPRAHPLPPGKLAVTGYPVRPGLDAQTRDQACQYWHLDSSVQTLLVWGGSQGAHAVNVEIGEQLPRLLELCQLIHVSGEADHESLGTQASSLPETLRSRYVLRSYLHDGVPEALAAADLAVSRAGASVLGEFPIARLPSILVPYPHAGAHQALNARFLVDAGAAVLLPEERVRELVPTIERLLSDRPTMSAMRDQAASLARPNAARDIAALITELAGRARIPDGEPEAGASREPGSARGHGGTLKGSDVARC